MRLSDKEQLYFDGFVDGFLTVKGGDKYDAGKAARAIIRKRRNPKCKQLTLAKIFYTRRKRAA
jgi:hypothetical protein